MSLRLARLGLPALIVLLASSATSLLWAAAPAAKKPADWPQFRGPNHDAKCTETGLLKEWPEGGPKLLWQIKGLGRGFSSVSIVGGKLFTMGDLKLQGAGESQCVMAFDLATREKLWATRVGPPHGDGGPRSTPTVDGESLYVIGTDGDLVCVETATGKVRWQKNFGKDFGGHMMSGWRYSESPLVDGDKVVCTPGGKDATIVALNKKTGETLWKCAVPNIGRSGGDGAAYASMVVAEIDGVRQYIQLIGRGAVGVAADTGKFLWGYNRVANGTAVIPSAVVRGNHVFVSSAYGAGAALLKITRDGDGFKADEVYFLDAGKFQNHHGGMVLMGDHIYGGHGQNQGTPTCVELLTGKIVWQPKAPAGGSAAVLFADGNLIFRYDSGLVALIEATPAEFRMKSRFKPAVNDGPGWPHPVICDGKLYLRSHDTLMCYDVRGK